MTQSPVEHQGRVDHQGRVAIVGGGLAGLAAAWALSDFPLEVTLFEARKRVGGRASSYYDSAAGHDVDFCQHVAMGCCTNFLWLMQQAGLLDQFTRETELTFLAPQQPPATIAPIDWLPAPLHRATSLSQLNFLTRRQRSEVRRGIWRLMRTRPGDVRGTMQQWLIDAGQAPQTIERFWDVLLVSALGEHARHAGFAPARKVLIDGFLASNRAADVWIPQQPLSQLLGSRLADRLRQRGVRLEQATTVKRLGYAGGDTIEVVWDPGPQLFQQVVAAVPWHALGRLLHDEPLRSAVPQLDRLVSLPTSPISGLHLWFDAAITERRHCVLVDGLAQWLFRPEHFSVAEAAGEHYHQVVISASSDLRGMPEEQVVAAVISELSEHFPLARRARLLRHRLVTDPRSVFSVRPEVEAIRPPQSTTLRRLHLAGDYTQTGWPATMEGAVISGFRAADSVLRACGVGSYDPQPGLSPSWLASWLIRAT